MDSQQQLALAVSGNLRRLMEHHQVSQAQLSKRTGVGQSTLSNLLDAANPLEINPRMSTLHQLSQHFQVPAWLFLVPDVPLEMLLDASLATLIEQFRKLPPSGRANVQRIADGELRYAEIEAAGSKARKLAG